jgi:hypothetical protein
MKILTTLTATLAAIALCQCSPYQRQGALVGTLAGGAIGAVAGDDSDDVIKGAALGAAAGTAAAAIHEDSKRRRAGDPPPPPGTSNPPPPSTGSSSSGGYPVARKTSNPNQVISPYAPYNVIDITGFKRGDLARDPGNRKIFRIP